ncbi:MAG: response regulator [Desulfovibrio sp.]|jgi:signal transduction histidine kinase/ActR/RegA family two-component response regulator|nr:response regulator [Desulfovibrio sp.]
MTRIKSFFSSLLGKAFLVILLVMNVPFFFTGYMAKNIVEQMLLREKENKLMSIARLLDKRLDPGGYATLLFKHGAENSPREEKIRILNEELAGITDDVAHASSETGIGVGYYSRDLDAIITYGPSENFAHTVGQPIRPDHPGRGVMQTGIARCVFGTMVRGNILNAMFPVIRNGETIGYIWANELTQDVEKQFGDMTGRIFYFMIFCSLLSFTLLILLSRRMLTDIGDIISGLKWLRVDLNKRLREPSGELGEIAKSVNVLAADLGKANKETRRVVSILQNVMGNVDAIIYVCDPQNYKLFYINNYLCKLLNCAEYTDKPCYEIIHNRTEPCPDCPKDSLIADHKKKKFDSVRWETRNDLINLDLLMSGRLITWHDGKLLHMEVGTDVTQRNALALAEAANQAQRSFLARMSHELRTPMNGVLGMTRLAMQADPPPAQLIYLKKIQSSAALLLGVINDILDFSKIEAGKLEIEKHSFNVREMVDNIRELILPRVAEKDLHLNIEIDAAVPLYLVGDELRLSQVLLNLLGNASKFTLQGDISLTVSAKIQATNQVRLNCMIKDSGIGMSAAQQESLFQPFSQADASTSRQFGGTGLGLSISKALVELMGGAISVSSEPDKGSVFSFFVELEIQDDPQEVNTEEDKAWENERYDGLKFLLVEDNAINQEIALAILMELGAKVDVADNGEEGLNAFLANDYDLILMDMRMPIMDGLEATRRIRSSAKANAAVIPIIAMTANAMREDREAGKAAGMNGHITKPIDIHEMKNVLAPHVHTQGANTRTEV